MIIGALPQAFVTTPWGHFIAALPGIATYAGALWLAWQYNGPLPSSPPSLNAPQPKT